MGELGSFNLADVWEAVVDRVDDRIAVVAQAGASSKSEAARLTYSELEARSNALAHWMRSRGVRAGDRVGLMLLNGHEHIEGMLAAWKLRAIPVNVNYRYVSDELRYLLADADVVGVVAHRRFGQVIDDVAADLDALAWVLEVDDGTAAEGGDARRAAPVRDYEAAVGSSPTWRDFEPRSGDDLYVIYTGGTTGRPKGVVWRQEDAFFACIGGGDPMRLQGPVSSPGEVLERIVDGTFTYLPVAPLMHAAGQWTALSWLYAGGRVVLLPGPLDPTQVWRTVEAESVNLLTVVGDPVVRPLLDAWDGEGPFDVTSLLSIGSGGAPLSPSLKERLGAALPGVALVDGFGSSETGAQGSQRLEAANGEDRQGGGLTRFAPYGDSTAVLGEELRPVTPGAGEVGRVARTGHIPLRYHGDPDRTASTFVEVDGRRWVLTGDMATVDDDGSIQLLGRGSVCINTGGEKVFPEEVEGVLKSHPAVYDAVVVGVSDSRWGQRVAAVVQPVDVAPTLAELDAHCRERIAAYKVPRSLVLVEHVERSPTGKADYRWAADVAARGSERWADRSKA